MEKWAYLKGLQREIRERGRALRLQCESLSQSGGNVTLTRDGRKNWEHALNRGFLILPSISKKGGEGRVRALFYWENECNDFIRENQQQRGGIDTRIPLEVTNCGEKRHQPHEIIRILFRETGEETAI